MSPLGTPDALNFFKNALEMKKLQPLKVKGSKTQKKQTIE
jgi:hypothetical protein